MKDFRYAFGPVLSHPPITHLMMAGDLFDDGGAGHVDTPRKSLVNLNAITCTAVLDREGATIRRRSKPGILFNKASDGKKTMFFVTEQETCDTWDRRWIG